MKSTPVLLAFVLTYGLTLSACWDAELPPAEVRLLGLAESQEVAPEAAVELLFSGPIEPLPADFWLAVARSDGRPVPSSFVARDATLRIEPDPAWPAGTRLEIQGSGLADPLGRPIWPAAQTLGFWVASPERGARYLLIAPRPGERAPVNLGLLALQHDPPAPLTGTFWLEADERDVLPLTPLAGKDGETVFSVPARTFPCLGLCPRTRYRLRHDEKTIATIETATAADHRPPVLHSAELRPAGDSLALRVRTSEPVQLELLLTAPGGVRTHLRASAAPALDTVLSSGPLSPGGRYVFTIQGTDLAFNALAPHTVTATAPLPLRIEISELVPTPLRDWSDSAENGAPFDAFPGGASVTSSDEWIELVNRSAGPIDLSARDLVLRVLDGSDSETRLAALRSYFLPQGDLHHWPPGAALVVHPTGVMSSRGVVVELVEGEQRLDRVELDQTAGADHAGGASPGLAHEAIAKDPRGLFRWCRPSPGDPRPPDDCAPD